MAGEFISSDMRFWYCIIIPTKCEIMILSRASPFRLGEIDQYKYIRVVMRGRREVNGCIGHVQWIWVIERTSLIIAITIAKTISIED